MIAGTPLLLLLLSYVALCIIHAAFLKISAGFLKIAELRWKDVFIFASIISVLAFIMRMTALHGQLNLPLTISVIISLAIQLILGGWFFSHRSLTRKSRPVGWPDAVQLCALAFVFVTLTSIFISGISGILSTAILNTH